MKNENEVISTLPFQEGTGAADPDYFDTLKYRGFIVKFYIDNVAQQYFAIIDDEKIPLGYYNTNYKSELKHVIDRRLDVIYTYSEYPGAELKLINNAGYYDAVLTYRERIIDIALLDLKRPDKNTNLALLMDNLQELIEDGRSTLEKYSQLVNRK